MKELVLTGWMSNRGRQNVVSFWSKELEQNWRICAAYFESMLIDYNVHSNWGGIGCIIAVLAMTPETVYSI